MAEVIMVLAKLTISLVTASFLLRNLLIIVFIIFSALVTALSIYLSNRISQPIAQLAMQLADYKIDDYPVNNIIRTNTFEIKYLNTKFNELVSRTNKAYIFQKCCPPYIPSAQNTHCCTYIRAERIKKI